MAVAGKDGVVLPWNQIDLDVLRPTSPGALFRHVNDQDLPRAHAADGTIGVAVQYPILQSSPLLMMIFAGFAPGAHAHPCK